MLASELSPTVPESAAVQRLATLATAPVFVVGAPRSGTTWLQRILLSHPQLCGGQETHFFTAAAAFLRDFDTVPHSNRVVGMPAYWKKDDLEDALRSLWERTVEPLIVASPRATLLVEKTPGHALCMARIAQLLPRARFIHIIRDSRAVAASLLAASTTWAKSWAPTTARDAAIYWHRHVTHARTAGRTMDPAHYLELFYEDLFNDPVNQMDRIFRFLGIEATPQQLLEMVWSQRFENQKTFGGTPLPTTSPDARRPEPPGFFRTGTPDGWRADLSLLQKLTVWRYSRRLMADLGYTWTGRSPTASGQSESVDAVRPSVVCS